MRIIAGEWRSRRLVAPAGARPTADRVRQSLFDILGASVGLGPVLDLYAGSGALGLEALSRGAPSAIFVEANRAARVALERNLRALEAGARARVIGLPVLAALDLLAPEPGRFGVIFADPPYGDPGTPALLAALAGERRIWLEVEGWFVLEARAGASVPERAGALRRVRLHRVGGTALHLFAADAAREGG